MIVFSVSTYVKPKGAASAQNALSRISDSRGTLYTGISSGPRQDRADALEVGKSPTEVPPGTGRTAAARGTSVARRFASSLRRRALDGPGGEPEIPSENSPHPSVLVGGVRQRRSCALGWYRPSVGVPGT
jgi:hypothetical protein